DLETVEKKIQKYQRLVKSNDKSAAKCLEVLGKIKAGLEQGISARKIELEESDAEHLEDCNLLTIKPVIYVCNVDEGSVVDGNEFVTKLKECVATENAEVLLICGVIEEEIAQLDSREDKLEFLQDMGLNKSGIDKLIQACYNILELDTYFTAGEKEVRAWTIKKGTKAPQAAGVIHTDFEKGFIRAEVIGYEDFVALGSEQAVKEAGKMRVEGKEYIVKDGDVMHFRFNV
ncbi:UNVERIFIED_CONTAM: hypothetical protein GTU68_044122, partial [Idotea baltica]|nr:hypothetical protein [Idotea baltica]